MDRFAPVQLTTNVPALSAQVAGFGAGNGSVSLSVDHPSLFAAEIGSSFVLTAPETVEVNGSAWMFASWIGSNLSASRSLVGGWEGPANLTACFVRPLGTLCSLPGAPGLLELQVAPGDASGTIGGTPFQAESGSFAMLLRPGSYAVTVGAPGYRSETSEAVMTLGRATALWLNLTPSGTIAGTVDPAGANLSIDGQAVAPAPSGFFSVPTVPGIHDVSASDGTWYASSEIDVTVTANQTTTVSLVLQGLARVFGSVSPPEAIVTWEQGLPVERAGGTYSVIVPVGGPVWINASLPGYAEFASPDVFPTVGQQIEINVSLSPAPGDLRGFITPAQANVTLNGTPQVVVGPMDWALGPGWYYLNVSAPGFTSQELVVTIEPDATTWVNVTLVTAPSPGFAGPPLSWHTIGTGLAIDAVLLGGLAVTFLVARRTRPSPSVAENAR